MQIGITGAGKVGCSMGKYLVEHGISVAGYFSRSIESAESAATFTNTIAFCSLEELVTESDILFITTPDDTIGEVWEQIRYQPVRGKIVCHFSGSLSSAVFSDRRQTGASCCSVHPMFAFSDKFTSYKQLKDVMFTIEGDVKAIDVMRVFFENMGNAVSVISPESKVRYHAAASMISNMMIGLYQMSLNMLTDCGFEEEKAELLVEPLVKNNIKNVLQKSPAEALTGPIERNDLCTVREHLKVLNDGEREVYAVLGKVLLQLAREKNPERDYMQMDQMLTSNIIGLKKIGEEFR